MDTQKNTLWQSLISVVEQCAVAAEEYLLSTERLAADSDAHKRIYYPFAARLTSLSASAEQINAEVALAVSHAELSCDVERRDDIGTLFELYLNFVGITEQYLCDSETAVNATPFSPSAMTRCADLYARQLRYLVRP